MAAGAAVAGGLLGATPARAAEGRVLFGFVVNPSITPVMTALLKEMQNLYQPELGPTITPVPGNFGGMAIEALHKAPADGGTVLLAPSSMMTLLTHLRKLKSVDPVEDLVPVAPIAEFTSAFVIGPAVPASVKGVKDYVRWVQDNPTMANYGVSGLGSAPHFVGMALARTCDLQLRPVAYTGAQGMADVQNGALPAALMPLSIARNVAGDARVRLLAVVSEQRWPGMPEVPTLLELGLVDVGVVESFGIYVSARMSPAKRQELGSAVQRAAATSAVHTALAQAGMVPSQIGAADYATSLAQERARWAQIVRKYHFSIES